MSKKFLELLLPYPRIINELNGNFNINEKVTARISSKCEKSFEYWLGKFGIKNIETIESNDFSIIIGDENTISKPNSDNKEAYKIFVSEKGISVSANQEIGLSYAIRTLVKVQILEKNIPCMIIEDEPMVAFRGIHMCLFNYNDGSEKDDTHPDVVIKRIELAALMGYNHVFI